MLVFEDDVVWADLSTTGQQSNKQKMMSLQKMACL